jgi:hypothetical protein
MPTPRTATRPDDHPFDFNLNAVEAETELRPFVFLWAGKDNPNRRLAIQHLDSLDTWPVMAKATGGDLDAMLAMFEVGMTPEDWKAFRATPMPRYKLQALFRAYREHCGVGLGESQASSGS